MQPKSYFYTYLVGDGQYHRTSYALTSKKALYRYVREHHGLSSVYGIVKTIHKTLNLSLPAYKGKALLVKGGA